MLIWHQLHDAATTMILLHPIIYYGDQSYVTVPVRYLVYNLLKY